MRQSNYTVMIAYIAVLMRDYAVLSSRGVCHSQAVHFSFLAVGQAQHSFYVGYAPARPSAAQGLLQSPFELCSGMPE